ncbi:SusC/RagA family TonB-linked outer membrane protein [Seonamhaeicola marinus]|uniref:TonB-dependent receptor n=1 Tax=Seonamhaeicola marinus TaxID=1912246 RepID=A0A5D0IMP3_9FLAO|nr:TonB-dependent receptor [Seonamhaeicola marinus]TYA84180.1 TonB-dependent receptor [Seonamhaeicola marinus]
MKVLQLLKKRFQHRVFMFTVLLLAGVSVGFAQSINISGVVSDESGQPLTGANVLVKGTTTGAQTDFDGNYSLSAASDATLVVSYLGFVTKEVAVNGQTTLNITLTEDASQLDEIVIVGYGTTKKSDLTGAVAVVGSEDIEKYTYNDASQALQGRVAGVSVQAQGGAPGAGSNFLIRGATSFANNEPLFVIDGMITGSMSSIAPQDIESISVLKDASALAIYGSRAANGVVIITTKKGRGGKINVSLDTSYGVQKVINTYDWASASEYAQIVNDARDNDGQDRYPGLDQFFDPSYSNDLFKESLRTAGVKNINVRVTGGGEHTNYSASFTQFEQEGIVKYSDFKRQTLRTRVDLTRGKFKLENTIGLTRTVNNPNNYFNKERNLIPVIRLKNDAGDWSLSDIPDRNIINPNTGRLYEPGQFYGSNNNLNALGMAALQDRTNTQNTLLGNIALSYEILDGLTYKINLGLEHWNRNNYTFTPFVPVFAENGGNDTQSRLQETNTTFSSTLVEHTLSYNKTFADKHTIDLVAGFTEQKNHSRSLGVDARDFPNNDIRVASAAETYINVPSRDVTSAIHSYLGRLKYNFDDRYLLTASVRQDRSSLFKEGLRDATFPSAAFGWNISNEPFMEDFDALTNIKFRASYGEVGSNNVSAYQTDATISFFSEYITGEVQERQTGYAITRMVNPFISWETTKTTNFGLEFDALDSRLSVTMDYFNSKTEDILLNSSPVFYSGFGNEFPQNIASMENKGFEFLATYRDNFGDLSFSATANFSIIDNEVTSLGSTGRIVQGSFTSNTINSMEIVPGRPISSFYGWVVDGIYQTDAEAAAANDQKGNPVAGDLKFKDVDGDGDIDDDDQVALGSGIPDFEYGLNLSAEYKNWDLNLFFNGVSGNKILNGTKYRGYFDTEGNYFKDRLNSWTPSNTNTNVPRNTRSDNGFNRRMSDFYLENGGYFRLRNAQIGYSLPSNILEKVKISKARIYASATNLFTITDYSGYYPEVGRNQRGSNGRQVINTGIDEGAYPTPRTFQLGLQVSF